MEITIELPDKLTAKIQEKWGNISQKLLNNLAIEAYQNQLISTSEVGEMLNLSNRLEVHQFLKENGIYLNYDETELNQDLLTIKKLRN